jgi:nucleoside-diphosphate-sugar epimerase
VRRILVVGGAGYVGSVLTEEFLLRGYAVRVLDRLLFGDAGLQALRDRAELVEADMRPCPPGCWRASTPS